MTLKAGIIGFGKMGALHAKGYMNAGVKIAGIMDDHATENVYPIIADMETFLNSVDIVSISTPSNTHKAIALKCIRAGKPVLVEKPLAMNKDACKEIINLAIEHKVKVSVGHIERYNAGFKGLIENLSSIGNIKSVSAIRTNPSSNRILDVDVLADLTVHDLDLIRAICGGDSLENITINDTVYNAKLNLLDSIKASFTTNNISVDIYTSRVAEFAERILTVIGEKGTIIANLADRSATLNGVALIIENIDQIDIQLKSWVDSVVNNTDPVVSMYDGLFAVYGSDILREQADISNNGSIIKLA